MGSTILRTVQVGLALIVITAVTVAVAVVLGVMTADAALRIGLNVAAVIALTMLAGILLSALFGVGRRRGGD